MAQSVMDIDSNYILARVQCLTASATRLTQDTQKDRKRIKIFNNGPNTIYVGGSTVTAATGFPIPAGTGQEFRLRNTQTGPSDGTPATPAYPLYGITVTANQASPADTAVYEGE